MCNYTVKGRDYSVLTETGFRQRELRSVGGCSGHI